MRNYAVIKDEGLLFMRFFELSRGVTLFWVWVCELFGYNTWKIK